jgi:hypothetical protein
MAAKKKTKKKQVKTKRPAGKKARPMNKPTKKKLSKRTLPRKKAPLKKAMARKKTPVRKTTGGKTKVAPKESVVRKSRSVATDTFSFQDPGPRSGAQSGDLQGLSDIQRAGSESVNELLEEGNAFEADAVMGVEEADDAEGKEVRTHEVPEDDVPDEYLDKD